MANKPLPWYKFPYESDYGGAEPYGPYAKPDINIQCPDGTPITNLLAGTITGLNASDGHVQAFGAVVTLRLDKPLNALATHIAYLHLEPLPNYLAIGQHVPKGEVVGYSGGQSAQGSEKAVVGVALYNGPVYGEGPTFDLYNAVGNPLLDPAQVLKKAGNAGSGQKTAKETITSIAEHIRPDESVATLLAGMDVALAIQNPFAVDASKGGDSAIAAAAGGFISGTAQVLSGGIIPGGGIPFFESLFSPSKGPPDPFVYLGDVAEGLLQNFAAVFVRTLFIVFGIIVLVIVVQATLLQSVNKVLEPVGGISGAVKTVGAIA